MGGGPASSNPQNKRDAYNNPENEIAKTYQKPSENPFSKKNAKTHNLQPSPSEPEMENISVVVQEDSMQEKEPPINDRPIKGMKKNEKNENARAIQKDILANHDEQVIPAG